MNSKVLLLGVLFMAGLLLVTIEAGHHYGGYPVVYKHKVKHYKVPIYKVPVYKVPYYKVPVYKHVVKYPYYG